MAPLPAGGSVRVDVSFGSPVDKVYDFKFQCPKTNAEPKWPLYRFPKKGKKVPKGARKAPHADYDNMTQDQLIEEATGKKPDKINDNCAPCKKS